MKLVLLLIGIVIVLVVIGVVLYAAYGEKQMKKIPAMKAQDCIAYTLQGRKNDVITVGILQDGQMTYAVYGQDGIELPQTMHTYEIGSLTKTFTAALIQNAVEEGKLNLDDTLDTILPLPEGNRYPTLAQLLTHTSGLKNFYLETPMVASFFAGRNEFCGVTDEMLLNRLKKLSVSGEDAPFLYSNFSFATLGQVLEKVYDTEYTTLVNDYAASLGLKNTAISTCEGDLPAYWDWNAGDAYLPAGALTSTIEDMLQYAKLQFDESGVFAACHKPLKTLNATPQSNAMLNIRMDSIGMAWILDDQNGILWHNGGTGGQNCYLGVCPAKNRAVVVLSSLAPNYRIPATVVGVKLLLDGE